MALLDRLRRRQPWEDPDPQVRAEAVRHVAARDQDLLEKIARTDADPIVRRAAVRRLSAPAILSAIAAADDDAGVREKAVETLVDHASGEDAASAAAALAGLGDPRHLMNIALSGRAPAVRLAAVERLEDGRLLARVARTSEDAAVRSAAVGRITAPELIAEVALRSEHKDAALAAVERVGTAEQLDDIARRGRHKAAVRRARARLEAIGVKMPPAAVADELEAHEAIIHEAMIDEPAEAPFEPDVMAASEAVPAEEGPVGAEPPAPPSEAVGVGEVPVAEAGEPAAVVVEGPAALRGADLPGPAPEPAIATPAPALSEPQRRQQVVRHAEELCARLAVLAKAEPLALREADAALKEARTVQAESTLLPGKLARRLKDARQVLFARAQEVREAEEWRRWGNASVQEELCRRMEALVPREDLDKVAQDLKTLDAKWAEVKLAPRDEAETLRSRYQAVRAQVRARLDGYFAKKAATEAANRQAKEELVTRAESLADSTDWLKASEELKALQARWKQIGPLPRKQSEALWNRFRGACDRFFTRRKEDLKRRKHEWAANLSKKLALVERAEALASSTEWDISAAEIRTLQAEWKAVGPIRRDRSDEVWQRFRQACDAFFERYKHRDQVDREGRRAERESVAQEADALVAADDAPEDLAERLQALLVRARQIVVAPAEDQALTRRMVEARNRAVERWPERFKGTELDPHTSRTRKEKLCARVEALAAEAPPPTASLFGDDLARRLKEALASNTMGRGSEKPDRGKAAAEEVRAAQQAWSRLGPVPGEAGAALEERFRRACAQVLGSRPPRSAGAPVA